MNIYYRKGTILLYLLDDIKKDPEEVIDNIVEL